MSRRKGIAAAATLLIGVAAVLFLLTGRDKPELESASVDPERIRFGPTSQFDLAKRVPLPLEISLSKSAGASVRAWLKTGEEEPMPLSRPVPVGGSSRSVKLPVGLEPARRLAACRPHELVVEVRDHGGNVVARRYRRVDPTPPRCDRFFNDGTVWNRPLAHDAPTDARSKALADSLHRVVEDLYKKNFAPTINTTEFSVPVFTATATQKRVPMKLGGGREKWAPEFAAQLAEGVPIPPEARPAAGTDRHLVIWQPSTDTMWELWGTKKGDNGWTAEWGGRLDGVSKGPGHFVPAPSGAKYGGTASGLPLVGGLITRRDLARGQIDHALGFGVPNTRVSVWAEPAQRTDGVTDSEGAIPMGARFRLDPDLDIDALKLPRFTTMMARAAQRYGIVVRDTAPTVVFVAEDPASIGSNPWSAALKPSTYEVLRRFPWDHLEVMPMRLQSDSGPIGR